MNKIIFIFISFVSITYAGNPQHYAYIDLNRNTSSFFSTFFYQFNTVIGLLDQYENNKYHGVKVDCGENTESSCNSNNWWEYFFKKLDIGNTTGEFRRIPLHERVSLGFSLYDLSFRRAHELIRKYIKIRPEIKEKVSAYQKKFFDNSFVIGICYLQAPFSVFGVPEISYKKIYEMLLVHITEKPNPKIFIYTNDQRFYAFLKIKHPDIVFRYKKKKYFENRIDKEEYKLINCLLFAQVDLLIRTPSRLGFTASQFNPWVPVVEISDGDPDKVTELIE